MFIKIRTFAILLFTLAILSIVVGTSYGEPEGLNRIPPKWRQPLPSRSCPGRSDTNCHRSSPVLADLTGDGKLEIVVATNRGHILAYHHTGKLLWNVDTAPYFGMSAGKQIIDSSPAVADIDNDGRMEVVVGTGTSVSTICTQGGVIVLEDNGQRKPGWPVLTKDEAVPPSGCHDTVFSTPALGDLDRDGDMEIVFGSYDKRIYAYHHNARPVTGFPPDSYHFQRFGWSNLKGKLGDTIWSSPALADLNGDGYLDILLGTDEGNYDSSWKPVWGNWNCPYRPPNTQGYCGGSIYAVDRFGKLIDGFPRYVYDTVQSTPAVVDLEGDGSPEIFVGTGSYYHNKSPDHPTVGFRLYGLNAKGKDLPGWESGKVVGGYIGSSPSIGDITGDGKPNIVASASDNKLYAWHMSGQLVKGFPMTPQTHLSQVYGSKGAGTGYVLGDYTGDGVMEIFFQHSWEINIVDGKGNQITAPNPNDSRPVYFANGRVWNTPAVGDINGDGKLELVTQNSELNVWDLKDSTNLANWPMFKQNAARTGELNGPILIVSTDEIVIYRELGSRETHRLNFQVYGGQSGSEWRLKTNNPQYITFPQNSGNLYGLSTIDFSITTTPNLPVGNHNIGYVEINAIIGGDVQENERIPVKIKVVKELQQNYLPIID